MSTPVCRVCLAGNVGMQFDMNADILKLYETLASTNFFENGYPKTICSICYSQLLNCHKFSRMAHRSESVLRNLVNQRMQVTYETITALNLARTRNESDLHNSSNYDEIIVKNETIETDSENKIFITKEENMVNVEINPIKNYTEKNTNTLPECLTTEKNLPDIPEPSVYNNKDVIVKIELTEVSDEEQATIPQEDNTGIEGSSYPINDMEKDENYVIEESSFTVNIETDDDLQGEHTNGTDMYCCNVCNDYFSSKNSLIIHLESHTGVKSSNDKKTFKTPREGQDDFKTDSKLHDSEKQFACNLCNRAFKRLSNLQVHMRIHTGEKPYSCNTCLMRFAQHSSLQNHLKTHSSIKPYICETCHKAFSRKSGLEIHERIHSGEKPYACNGCDKAFSRQTDLQVHMRIHTGQKPYSCNVCNQKFTQRSSLSYHLKTHSEEKEHACPTCHKTFSRKTTLRTHMRIHTGERPFSCGDCDSSFHRKVYLENHMRIHTGEKPYSCDICHKTFSRHHHLLIHMKIHEK